MELIAVPVRARQLTDGHGVGGSFVVPHRSAGLARGLELDEELVVVDPDGEFHAATVLDIEFTLDDTHYTMEMGVRLPPQLVRERLAEASMPPPADGSADDSGHDSRDAGADGVGEETLQSVLDLLGRLRDEDQPGR